MSIVAILIVYVVELVTNFLFAKLYVPKGSLTAYQESDWATYFGNIIEMEE